MKTEHVFKPLPADWWGHKYFVAAGALESLEQSEEAKKRQMFCEDDQEALYNRTQDNKVAARQGLGVRGSAIKIAGGEFQGKKIKFDGEAGEDGHEDDTVGDVASLDGIKWKKLIAKTLRGEPSGNMKVRKLQKRVAAAVLSQLDAAVCVKRLESVVLQKLTSSSRFVVEGKVARCCC